VCSHVNWLVRSHLQHWLLLSSLLLAAACTPSQPAEDAPRPSSQDDASRENEGDFIMPAELATGEAVALMLRHCTGLICTAMPPSV